MNSTEPMGSSDRLLVLVILVIVLLVALYASRTTTPGLGLLVALVGLAVAYRRPVFGILVAVAMTVLAAVAPWAILLVIAFAGLVMLATKAPGLASTRVNPVIGVAAVNGARDVGADIGAGDGLPF
jgi:hypothetical protein